MNGPSTAEVSRLRDDLEDLSAVHRNDEQWRCVDCHGEWPCPVIRRRLLALYRREPERLVTYLRHFRDRARAELPSAPTRELDLRFFGWVPVAQTGRRRRPA
ncbi:flavin reductase [Micromonospora sp. NPDC050417]|uniref:flavin reductase n=1 Tax=Micromonospora sp. NPDC050417 TaxID=3364280 RepID=UPI0037B93D8A